tara:strand:+ start:317 stop:877 length:561 start_codon:yes stop_codon:yes gene_type:complete
MLDLPDLHRLGLKGTTNGYKILKAVDLVNTAHQGVLDYGKYRVMSCIPIELYTKVRTQESLVRDRFEQAIKVSKKDARPIELFVKSCLSLVKGYTLVIETAQKRGLSELDLDFYCFETSTGKEIYVVPNEDMKAILHKELNNDNLCIYSMPELCLLISNDEVAYEMKKKFQATLTGVKPLDKPKAH